MPRNVMSIPSCHQCAHVYCSFCLQKEQYTAKSGHFLTDIVQNIKCLAWSDPILANCKKITSFHHASSKYAILIAHNFASYCGVRQHEGLGKLATTLERIQKITFEQPGQKRKKSPAFPVHLHALVRRFRSIDISQKCCQ